MLRAYLLFKVIAVRILFYAVFILLASACLHIRNPKPGRLPTSGYRYLDLAVHETFDHIGDWRSYSDGDALSMNVAEGVYRINLTGSQYVWTQASTQYRNVIIEAVVTQVSDYDYNGFGIACRLDPANSGRGYFFLISGDGHYSIRWSSGRSLDAIVSAAPSDLIRTGKAANRIRAVCIDDYLALWINGQFAAEARDRRAAQGMAGLAGLMNSQGRRLKVEFDDLKIWNAAFDDQGRRNSRRQFAYMINREALDKMQG